MSTRQLVLLILALIAIVAWILRGCRASSDFPAPCSYAFPSYQPDFQPPNGTPASEIFALSQSYPTTLPPMEPSPWLDIDFRTHPAEYAAALLAYCLEGNTAIDFRVESNAVRRWYHVPWLHPGFKGREWRHGLTRERQSQERDLHPAQSNVAFNWAVGFYNPRGGYTIGQVWPDCGRNLPQPSRCTFPSGTVTFKLLFTTASTAQVPFLANSLSWTANIGGNSRSDQTVRLLQVDVAAKDPRSPIGWVFGTFVYDGASSGATVWDRLRLVGIAFGNDPTVQSRMNDEGAFVNADLEESIIQASILETPSTPVGAARARHLGLGGRLNGPVDNPISSCTSCHGKAGVLESLQPDPIEWLGRNPKPLPSGSVAEMFPARFTDYFGVNTPAGSSVVDLNCFVAALPGMSCNGPQPMTSFVLTDYSLQVAIGIENYYGSIVSQAEAAARESAPSKR